MTTALTTTTNFVSQKIDRASVESVKNAIFQRVTSKASGTAEAVANNNKVYNTEAMKTNFQNDLMAEARQSVAKGANPFSESIFKSQATQAAASTNVNESQASGTKALTNKSSISNSTKNIRSRVIGSTALQNGMLSSAMRESVMVEAREQMTSNNTLMSRLQFLNTQSAINTYPSAKFA